jgi:hypothetical protein
LIFSAVTLITVINDDDETIEDFESFCSGTDSEFFIDRAKGYSTRFSFNEFDTSSI